MAVEPSYYLLGDDSPLSVRSPKTEAAYAKAIDHYSFYSVSLNIDKPPLPAKELSIVFYILRYADIYTVNTLRFQLSAIGHWHREAGYPDPTKSQRIRDLLREIDEKKSHPPQQAVPIALGHIQKIVQVIEEIVVISRSSEERPALLRALRDRALILNGFWGGFRGGELTRMQVEFVEVYPGEKLDIGRPNSEQDHIGHDTFRSVIAQPQLCPVAAYIDWIQEAGITKGPVFRKIDQWGKLSQTGLTGHGVNQVFAKMARDAGLNIALSAASLRLGFIDWAGEMGWNVPDICRYLQSKSYESICKRMRGKSPDWGELAMDYSPPSAK